MKADPKCHSVFMDRYYRHVRHVYDVTRKYYLFGRDSLLERMLEDPWKNLVEVGVGTGRNLRYLHTRRPDAHYYGIDVSTEMLKTARKRCPWAQLALGSAEDRGSYEDFQVPFDCVLFSYSLSMIQNPSLALESALTSLSNHGKIGIVDFADLKTAPNFMRKAFHEFLKRFHVKILTEDLIKSQTDQIHYGPYRYFLTAEILK